MPYWKDLINSLHQSIERVEDELPNKEWVMRGYVDERLKTKAMLVIESRSGKKIEVLLRREAWCSYKPKMHHCKQRETACLFHGWDLSERQVESWRRRLGMVKHPNKVVNSLLTNLQTLSRLAEESKRVRVPIVVSRKELKVLIQSLSELSSEVEIEE